MSDHPNILKAAQIKAKELPFQHPWNPNSQIFGTMLGSQAGLKRTGINIARIPPGKEAFVYHSHTTEEEWIYILSGQGELLLNGQTFTLEAGDFAAFPAPGYAHLLSNKSSAELVYLMGGENHPFEVAEFPSLGRVMIRRADGITVFETKDGKSFGPTPNP